MPATTRRGNRPASAGLLARRVALLALFEDEFRPSRFMAGGGRPADGPGGSHRRCEAGNELAAGSSYRRLHVGYSRR